MHIALNVCKMAYIIRRKTQLLVDEMRLYFPKGPVYPQARARACRGKEFNQQTPAYAPGLTGKALTPMILLPVPGKVSFTLPFGDCATSSVACRDALPSLPSVFPRQGDELRPGRIAKIAFSLKCAVALINLFSAAPGQLTLM